jgi:hypothetical protein
LTPPDLGAFFLLPQRRENGEVTQRIVIGFVWDMAPVSDRCQKEVKVFDLMLL